MKTLYKITGIASFATGIAGVFVPLLPTTCFILFAAWCFSKSSPKWHEALRNNSMVGNSVKNWEQDRTIPLTAKRIALGSMSVSAIFCYLTINSLTLSIISLSFIALGMWFVSQIDTTENSRY